MPLQREIIQKIDFVPGESFLNKASYKMTPDHHKEIEKQVQELLDQGLIMKSISPCVVLVVLAPKKGGKWRMCTNSREINSITISFLFLE